MAFDYRKTAQTVSRLLFKFGRTQTIRRVTSGSIDPVTGIDTSAAPVDIETVGLEKTINTHEIDGTNIQAGDRMFILDGSQEPRLTDKLKIGTEYWPIVNVRKVSPTGVDLVIFAQVRK